jgi:hypothetical protein
MDHRKQPVGLKKQHLQQLKIAAQDARRGAEALRLELQKLPQEVREKVLGSGSWWAWAYELSVIQHSALFYWSIGQLDKLRAALDADKDKNQVILDFARSYVPGDEIDRLFESEGEEFRKALAMSLLLALMRQMECLEKEGSYISDLVQKVANHEDEALFKALHIDRTLVSCPTFAARIARAEIEDDKLFFANLARALKTRWKKKSPQKKEDHKDLRIMLQATYESGQLQKMSMTEADELFIKELAVYSEDGEDPARSLQRFILRFKNNK